MPRFRLRPPAPPSNQRIEPVADLTRALPLLKRVAPQPETSAVTEEQRALVARVQERLLKQIELRFEAEVRDVERLQRHIANTVNAVLEEDNTVLPERER